MRVKQNRAVPETVNAPSTVSEDRADHSLTHSITYHTDTGQTPTLSMKFCYEDVQKYLKNILVLILQAWTLMPSLCLSQREKYASPAGN